MSWRQDSLLLRGTSHHPIVFQHYAIAYEQDAIAFHTMPLSLHVDTMAKTLKSIVNKDSRLQTGISGCYNSNGVDTVEDPIS